MQLKIEMNHLKTLVFTCLLGTLSVHTSQAQHIDCTSNSKSSLLKKICVDPLAENRKNLETQYLTAYLISDAPLRLLADTHLLWFSRLEQCKSLLCYQQLFEQRIDDLNVFTSLNQSLTQHYLKYEKGKISKMPVHLKIHQLSKDRIKVEGISYRNANNKLETQFIPFLSYTTPDKKTEIVDNEHDCTYSFKYQRSILKVSSKQKGCERFVGIYRLYD